jgi:formate dehydrogenase major subunit
VVSQAARAKFQDAWGCELPAEPGRTVPEMLRAIEDGEIRAMYILGENPVVSDPDSNHTRHVLESLEFLVVQDIFLTETAQLADVVLPGASFAEKDGTFTNTERRVQRVRKAVDPVGSSRPDWQVIQEVGRRTARKIGHGAERLAGGFRAGRPSQVMREIASLTPSYAGISHARLDTGGLQWPVPTPDHPGTPTLHTATFARGKGLFSPVEYSPPAEMPDREYPFLLNTGRRLYHYHTGSLTRRVPGLAALVDREYLQVNPADAERLGMVDGDVVTVESRRGSASATVEVTPSVLEGSVFMDFHFAESPANALTTSAHDPVAKIAQLKICAVRLEKGQSGSPVAG